MNAKHPTLPTATLHAAAAVLLAVLWGAPALAQTQRPRAPEAPPPPPLPATETPTIEGAPPLPPKVQEEELQPSVRIRKEQGQTIEEYSLEGRVYMIKVIPEKGPPYYLFDTDGDGQVQSRADKERDGPIRPVMWKLKEW